MRRSLLIVFLLCFLIPLLDGCAKKKESTQKGSTPAVGAEQEAGPVQEPLEGGPYPALLMTQAQFNYKKGTDGKLRPVPGPAKLVIVRKGPGGWSKVTVEDPDSNVFHKALPFRDEVQGSCILTIGANKAILKLWRWDGQKWITKNLWQTSFGGKWDRFRDVEVGDVNGDGRDEIVIATHDQGVVAVLTWKEGRWNVEELIRQKDTFVHEVEIGDVDGDGVKEFFTTPSEPNKATMLSQPGGVDMYKWNGSGYDRTRIDSFEKSHAKEILAVDLDGDGTSTLFSVVEAETVKKGKETEVVEPVKIKEYIFGDEKVEAKVIVTLDDRQCRFLTPGDLDRDGVTEIVAAAMKSGLWLLDFDPASKTWNPVQIDADSSGFEHTALAADIEGDGTVELYVAADDQMELKRYEWDGTRLVKEVLLPISKDEITWNLTAARF